MCRNGVIADKGTWDGRGGLGQEGKKIVAEHGNKKQWKIAIIRADMC